VFIKRLATVAVGRLRLGLVQRQETAADLRTVQVVEGSSGDIAAMVAVLERGGCDVESVIDLGNCRWQITARSHD
jgi:hypothetical protein